MEIDLNLERDKKLSDNSKLMALLEEVEKHLGNPNKRRVLTEFQEIQTSKGRRIMIKYSTYTLGFASRHDECVFSADKDYKFQEIIAK